MILNKDKRRSKKILLPSFTSPIKYFPYFHLPQKSNFINFVSTLKQKQEININMILVFQIQIHQKRVEGIMIYL